MVRGAATANRPPVSFGDNVRIRSTPLTEGLGLANMVGSVFGETTPSSTGMEVIGDAAENHAIHVFFGDTKKGFWFVPELLELIGHAPGAQINLKEVPTKTWIRSATGGWEKIDAVDRDKGVGIRIRRCLSWIGIGAVLEGLVVLSLFPQNSTEPLTTWQIGVACFMQAAVFGLLIWALIYMLRQRQKDRNFRPSSPR